MGNDGADSNVVDFRVNRELSTPNLSVRPRMQNSSFSLLNICLTPCYRTQRCSAGKSSSH